MHLKLYFFSVPDTEWVMDVGGFFVDVKSPVVSPQTLRCQGGFFREVPSGSVPQRAFKSMLLRDRRPNERHADLCQPWRCSASV